MKTIDDNEIIETSRGKKRIGPLFDENAILRAENAALRAVLAGMVAKLAMWPGSKNPEGFAEMKAARTALAGK